MTAEEWETCQEPAELVGMIGTHTGFRKARLLAVACCRRVWRLFTEERLRLAIEAAEAYADGRIDKQALKAANRGARLVHSRAQAAFNSICSVASGSVVELREVLAYREAALACVTAEAAERASGRAEELLPNSLSTTRAPLQWIARGPIASDLVTKAARLQSDLIRCVFGTPLRPPIAFGPAILAHNDSAAVKLATVIYQERDPTTGELDAARLAILADALEDAGCTTPDLLGHFRGSGPHVRGCWAVDLVLAKE